MEDNDSKNDKFPVNPELVCDFLLQSKFMRPHGSHPRVLKNLSEVIGRALSMIFQWSGEFEEVPVTGNWRMSQFQRGARGLFLVTPGLSVSLQ